MKTKRTPQEKKRLSYTKDHVVMGGENQKAFRKNWPKKKAKANRAERRKTHQDVQTLHPPADADAALDLDLQPETPHQLDKWGVKPLGKHVAERLSTRAKRPGAKLARRQSTRPNTAALQRTAPGVVRPLSHVYFR